MKKDVSLLENVVAYILISPLLLIMYLYFGVVVTIKFFTSGMFWHLMQEWEVSIFHDSKGQGC